MLRLDEGTLFWSDGATGGSVQTDTAHITGFIERFGRWTGRSWLEVVGPGWRVPIDESYGRSRAQLRDWFSTHPFTSEWSDGRFPPAPFGWPPYLALGIGFGAVTLSIAVLGWLAPPVVIAPLLVVWPLLHLHDSVEVRESGLRIGSAWASAFAWHEVEALCIERRGRFARIWMRSRRGYGQATLPIALLPALRARLRRIAALELTETTPEIEDSYRRWQAPTAGIAWGVGAGALIGAWSTPMPWVFVAGGLLCFFAAGLLAAAIQARVTGWGTGAVLMLTALYTLVLITLGIFLQL